MIEFEMPKKTDKERYEKFKEALEESDIPFGETFSLDIEEGCILNLAKRKVEFRNSQMYFGCVANPPQFSCWTIGDGMQIAYKRKMHSHAKKDGFFKNGVPVVSEITKALSVPKKYYETIWFEKLSPKYEKIKIFSDVESWKFAFNDCEIVRDKKEDGGNIKYAVAVLLDFYQSNKL